MQTTTAPIVTGSTTSNAATGRGRVLYRRYDGHYGLIRPSDDTTEESS